MAMSDSGSATGEPTRVRKTPRRRVTYPIEASDLVKYPKSILSRYLVVSSCKSRSGHGGDGKEGQGGGGGRQGFFLCVCFCVCVCVCFVFHCFCCSCCCCCCCCCCCVVVLFQTQRMLGSMETQPRLPLSATFGANGRHTKGPAFQVRLRVHAVVCC